ncbi:NVEALA domain-containing protein [uncultured Bacteroides sp.]|mgnify:CR=1 FL=1|uniref:NVEALA domain-containing protein n=1 Tax=uncultured Bacteroides sp. TaxID=162156 RepID=UPI00259BCF50|nr:NVEALA domain-containing protein [uncultured Bacteroides sp.]
MRKKIMKVAFVAVFAAVAGYGVYMNQRTEAMSDLMLANVEALARYELPEVDIACGSSEGKCWGDDGYEYTWTPFGGFKVTRCKFVGYTWVSCIPGLPA